MPPRQTKYEEHLQLSKVKYSGKILIYNSPSWNVLFPIVEIIRKLPENSIINHIYSKNQNIIKTYGTQYGHLVFGIPLKKKDDYLTLRTVKFIFIFSDSSDDNISDNLIKYCQKTKTPYICYSTIDSVYHFYHETKVEIKEPDNVIELMETIKDKELVNKFDDLFPEFEIIPSNEKKQNTLEECIMIIKKSRDTAMSNNVYSTKIPFDPNFSKLKYLEKEKEKKKIVYDDELPVRKSLSSFFKKK